VNDRASAVAKLNDDYSNTCVFCAAGVGAPHREKKWPQQTEMRRKQGV